MLEDTLHAGPKFRRSRIKRVRRTYAVEKLPLQIHRLPAGSTSIHVRLEGPQIFAPKLVIKIQKDPLTILVTWVHGVPALSGGAAPARQELNISRNFSRARPKRDITVPAGQSRIPAISW